MNGFPFWFYFFYPLWRLLDRFLIKHNHHWAFTTHHIHSTRFVENQRAMFEYVKDMPAIKKIIFYRGGEPDFEVENGVNYEIVRYGSLRSFYLLSRCKVVFLGHSVSMDFSLRWGERNFKVVKLDLRNRLVINLWHGIPLKRLLSAANETARKHTERVSYRRHERQYYCGLIASSDIDSYAMGSMFYPLEYPQVWITGLPRNDFLKCSEFSLPEYIRRSLINLKRIKGEKKLVVYAPTYRQVGISDGQPYYQFSQQEVEKLKELLRNNDAILGYRPHYFKNSEAFFNLSDYIDGSTIVDLSHTEVPEFSAVARECDLLITDYSSVYLECVYLDRPVISFAYDYEEYKSNQDGLLYDMSLAFPGPVCLTFDNLILAIVDKLKNPDSDSMRMEYAKRIFFNYSDGNNSERVYQQVIGRM